MGPPESPQSQPRGWIIRAFSAVEDVVYIGLGLLLAGSAITLLGIGLIDFGQSVGAGKPRSIELLERILLILLVVELLYTVQVSFRKHTLVPEIAAWYWCLWHIGPIMPIGAQGLVAGECTAGDGQRSRTEIRDAAAGGAADPRSPYPATLRR
jgi:hypothetical protein